MRKHVLTASSVLGLSVVLLAGCGQSSPDAPVSSGAVSGATASGGSASEVSASEVSASAGSGASEPTGGSAAAGPSGSAAGAAPAGGSPGTTQAPAAGPSSGSQAAEAGARTRRYSNARYMFSVDVPTSMQELGESGNGDGNTFTTGEATFMVFGTNEGGTSLADEVAGVEGQGGRVLERSGGDADFTITAEVGSDIQRTRYLTGSGSRVVGQWVYPKAQQGQFDVTAEQALRSLRAQGLDQPH